QSGDQVVMFFSRFVIEQDAFLQRVFDDLFADLSVLTGGGGSNFKNVVSGASVAAGIGRDLSQHRLRGAYLHRAQPAPAVSERPLHQADQLFFGELIQDVNAAARKQGAVDLERRVFGGGADQPDIAALHVGKKRVLLSAIEAVNFIHKQNGSRSVLAGLL